MYHLRFILIPTLLLATNTNGQQSYNFSNLVGKTYVSKTLEYLELLNDSTLFSSINSYTDTTNFFLQNDTIFVEQRYLQTDQTGTKWMNRLYDYKIIALNDDTLRLKNNYRFAYKPDNWEDTLFFVTIENLKESIKDFKSLNLDLSSPWSGTRQITIDSSGNVTFIDRPIPYSINNPDADKNAKPKNIKGQLTRKEFTNFKNLLSKSLPSRLPFKRDCPMDGTISNFDIVIGSQIIKSTGCDLSWIHIFLLNYLYDIDQNKGLITKKL